MCTAYFYLWIKDPGSASRFAVILDITHGIQSVLLGLNTVCTLRHDGTDFTHLANQGQSGGGLRNLVRNFSK